MRHLHLALILATSLSTLACGPRNKDKLDDSELAGAEGGKSEKAGPRCTTRVVTDEVKRQLFARAAEIRGSNGDNYAKIGGFALIDISGAVPVAEVSALELIDCRGHATVRLPAGLKVAGGRTTLGGDVEYSVGPGSRGAVSLGQSDAISIPLATLTQNRSATSRPPTQPRASDPLAPTARTPSPPPSLPSTPISPSSVQRAPTPVARPRPQALPERLPPPPAAVTSAARPSFDCRRARTSGERAVCDDPSLAALDRSMASQYRSAAANGGPEVRRLLAETRNRFLTYRDRCASDACIANSYRGRMREIDDIVAGRWRAPR